MLIHTRNILLTAMLGIVLAGCAGDPRRTDATRLEPGVAEEPSYRVGDVYAFDNPDVSWRVVSLGEDRVHWRSSSGDTQVTTFNPLLPALEWKSEQFGHGRRLITGQKGELFPMRLGARMTFRETVSIDQPPYGWEFDWSCEVAAIKQVVTQVGASNAYQVECGRQQPDEYVFYYLPEAGHYVRMEYRAAETGQRQSRQLVAYTRDNGRIVAGDLPQIAPVMPPSEPAMAEYPHTAPGATAQPARHPADASPAANRPTASDRTELFAASGREPANGVYVGGGNDLPAPASVQQAALPPQPQPAVAARPSTQPSPVAAAPGRGTPQSEQRISRPAAAPTEDVHMPREEGIAIHLASYRNPGNAERGWRQLVKSNGDVLDGLQPNVRRVDLGERGIFYRLQAVAVSDVPHAEALCRELQGRGAYCKISER